MVVNLQLWNLPTLFTVQWNWQKPWIKTKTSLYVFQAGAIKACLFNVSRLIVDVQSVAEELPRLGPLIGWDLRF